MSDEGLCKSSSLQYVSPMGQDQISAPLLQLAGIGSGFKVAASDEYLYTSHGRNTSQSPLRARECRVTARPPWRFDNSMMLSTGVTRSQRPRKITYTEGDRYDRSQQSSRIAKCVMHQRLDNFAGTRIKERQNRSNVHKYPTHRTCTSMGQQPPKDALTVKDIRTWRLPEEGTGHDAPINTSLSRESADPFPWNSDCRREAGGGGGGSGKPTSTTGSQGVSLYATAGPSLGGPYGLAY